MTGAAEIGAALRAKWAADPEGQLRARARRQPLPVIRVSGRDVPLVFTGFAVDPFGSRRLMDLLVAANDGEPGCARALAELLEVASAGWVRAEDVVAGRVVVPYAVALAALVIAWNSFRKGAPPAEPQRWWERLFRLPLRSAQTRPGCSALASPPSDGKGWEKGE